MTAPRTGTLIPALATATGLGLAAREMLLRTREADLRGQVAVIAGGSRGLGLAIAHELVDHGCRLAICARDPEELERARAELAATGADVLAITCDVADEIDVDAMVRQVIDHYGRIDLLFTVAGVIQVSELENLRLEDFREAMNVMFWGTVYPAMAVLPGMRARGSGRIATITSIGGKISVPHLLPYCSAKFAAVGFSEGLTAEVAADGVHVTTVVPGLMRTGSHLNAQFKGTDDQQEAEYTWFALGATAPLSPPADRAARIIVRAVRRGQAECIYTLPFSLASRFHGLAPSTTIRLMQLANAILPHRDAIDRRNRDRGMEVAARQDSSLLRAATTLGEKAAQRFNQYPGPVNTPDA